MLPQVCSICNVSSVSITCSRTVTWYTCCLLFVCVEPDVWWWSSAVTGDVWKSLKNTASYRVRGNSAGVRVDAASTSRVRVPGVWRAAVLHVPRWCSAYLRVTAAGRRRRREARDAERQAGSSKCRWNAAAAGVEGGVGREHEVDIPGARRSRLTSIPPRAQLLRQQSRLPSPGISISNTDVEVTFFFESLKFAVNSAVRN